MGPHFLVYRVTRLVTRKSCYKKPKSTKKTQSKTEPPLHFMWNTKNLGAWGKHGQKTKKKAEATTQKHSKKEQEKKNM